MEELTGGMGPLIFRGDSKIVVVEVDKEHYTRRSKGWCDHERQQPSTSPPVNACSWVRRIRQMTYIMGKFHVGQRIAWLKRPLWSHNFSLNSLK